MKKILVIEDETCTRNLFMACLEAEGYYTVGAENGHAGIYAAQKQLPDLVICDILMPELDGYSVLATLRQDPVTAAIPFIFLTASMTKAELPKKMEASGDCYLAKPATADELLQSVVTQLERQIHSQGCQSSRKLREQPPSSTLAVSQSIFPPVDQLNEVFEFIEGNYYQQITLNDVAQAAGYSPAYLTNLVGSRTGRTVNRWIVERRMVEARSFLMHSDWSIEQIARTVGYTNVRHFFRQFRQYHGITPQDWRKKTRLVDTESKDYLRLEPKVV